jgi:hypothetical protein
MSRYVKRAWQISRTAIRAIPGSSRLEQSFWSMHVLKVSRRSCLSNSRIIVTMRGSKATARKCSLRLTEKTL